MCELATFSKASRRNLVALNRKIETKANPLSYAIEDWLVRYAEAEMRDIRRKMKSGGLVGAKKAAVKKKLTKAELARFEAQLGELLQKYGLSQARESGITAANAVGEKWIVESSLLEDIIREKENKVKLIMSSTNDLVRESIKAQVSMALAEDPQPNIMELGRRIRETWTGDEGLFSATRAKTIARNEVAQSRAIGQSRAYSDVGIETVGWLPFSNDGKSGEREHWRMADKSITVAAMNGSDKSKWFELPSGERCPYPKWIGLIVGEVVNCRCNLIALG